MKGRINSCYHWAFLYELTKRKLLEAQVLEAPQSITSIIKNIQGHHHLSFPNISIDSPL